MRNNSGDFKVNRKWKSNPILAGNTNRIALWITLLDFACWKDQETYVLHGKNKVQLKRGQLQTSSKELSTFCGVSESGIDKILKVFEKDGMCKNETTSTGRCISILNYDNYQYKEEPGKNEVRTKDERGKNEVGHTNKVNKVKEDKEGEEVVVEKLTTTDKSFVQIQKERLLGTDIKSQEDLTAYYFNILNEMGINLANSEERSTTDWACFNVMFSNSIINLNDLKERIYEYVFQTCIKVNINSKWVSKSFANYLIEPKYLLSYLQKHKYVGLKQEAVKKQDSIFD